MRSQYFYGFLNQATALIAECRRIIPTIIYLVVIAAVVVVGMLDMSDDYYLLLRLLIFVAVLRELWLAYEARQFAAPLSWMFLGLAILYNPIFPVHLQAKETWTATNIAVWLLLAWVNFQSATGEFLIPSISQPQHESLASTPEASSSSQTRTYLRRTLFVILCVAMVGTCAALFLMAFVGTKPAPEPAAPAPVVIFPADDWVSPAPEDDWVSPAPEKGLEKGPQNKAR